MAPLVAALFGKKKLSSSSSSGAAAADDPLSVEEESLGALRTIEEQRKAELLTRGSSQKVGRSQRIGRDLLQFRGGVGKGRAADTVVKPKDAVGGTDTGTDPRKGRDQVGEVGGKVAAVDTRKGRDKDGLNRFGDVRKPLGTGGGTNKTKAAPKVDARKGRDRDGLNRFGEARKPLGEGGGINKKTPASGKGTSARGRRGTLGGAAAAIPKKTATVVKTNAGSKKASSGRRAVSVSTAGRGGAGAKGSARRKRS